MDRVLVLEHGKLTPGADALAETAASAAGFAGARVRIS
jgi:hypothetical protein